MFGHIPFDIILFLMLYAGAAVTDVIACVYLLLRRSNAFDHDVASSVRLRRWTAVFFATMALSHVWYMPICVLTSSDEIKLGFQVGGLLDCITIVPLAIIVLFCMLQDRRRPLWPAYIMTAPLAVGMVVCIATHSDAFMPKVISYFLLLAIGLFIYMVHAVKQYGRWLRDNYADLEHKEVWQSFIVLSLIVLMFGIYVGDAGGPAYKYIVQVCGIVLVCYLLWRVETLSDLPPQPLPIKEEKLVSNDEFDSLLQQRYVSTQLYLQHDLTGIQLAEILGTNRTYLGHYFSSQNTTYNAYINTLRINHFINLYREAVAARRPFSAKQLASDSGYRSYSTFSLAFKQRMGQSVTAWMHETAG